MNIQFSERLQQLPPYLFVEIDPPTPLHHGLEKADQPCEAQHESNWAKQGWLRRTFAEELQEAIDINP